MKVKRNWIETEKLVPDLGMTPWGGAPQGVPSPTGWLHVSAGQALTGSFEDHRLLSLLTRRKLGVFFLCFFFFIVFSVEVEWMLEVLWFLLKQSRPFCN